MKTLRINDILAIQGDCLEGMQKLIDKGVTVSAIIADLPYGTTTSSWDSVIPFEPMWSCIDKLIVTNGAICLFGTEPFSSSLRLSNSKMFKYDWIWHKSSCSNFIAANYQPLRKHEVISVFSKGAASYSRKNSDNKMTYNPQMGEITKAITKEYEDSECRKAYSEKSKNGYKLRHNNVGRKFPESVIYFAADTKKIHPTQKPVKLMEYLVNTYSNTGDVVLDFTAGSFSTGVACINTNRKCICIEKDPDIFELGVNRIMEVYNARK